jgi:epimerase transport system membrane fusion protein
VLQFTVIAAGPTAAWLGRKASFSTRLGFSAFKSRATRKAQGRVVALSADRLVEQNDQNRIPFYRARVEIPPEAIRELSQQGLVLVAGMPAEVLINTGERTLFDFLVAPLKDTFARSFIED